MNQSDKDAEKAEPTGHNDGVRQDPDASSGELLSQYSAREITTAIRRLDWNLIPLSVHFCPRRTFLLADESQTWSPISAIVYRSR